MYELSPLLRDQRKMDADHLKLLAVFHFVVSGLAVLGIGFLLMHYMVMSSFMFNPKMWEGRKGGPAPQEIFALFKWIF